MSHKTPGSGALPGGGETGAYVIDEQIGFMLRQAHQRNILLFTGAIGDEATPAQWAVLAKLAELGPLSQNLLGRHAAIDAATVKGVVDRLVRRGLVTTRRDAADGRRLAVALTPSGQRLVNHLAPKAKQVSEEVLAGLSPAERDTLKALLRRLVCRAD